MKLQYYQAMIDGGAKGDVWLSALAEAMCTYNSNGHIWSWKIFVQFRWLIFYMLARLNTLGTSSLEFKRVVSQWA